MLLGSIPIYFKVHLNIHLCLYTCVCTLCILVFVFHPLPTPPWKGCRVQSGIMDVNPIAYISRVKSTGSACQPRNEESGTTVYILIHQTCKPSSLRLCHCPRHHVGWYTLFGVKPMSSLTIEFLSGDMQSCAFGLASSCII